MTKNRKIIGWILTVLVSIFLLAISAPGKFMTLDQETKLMMKNIGVTEDIRMYIGFLEIFCVILFLIPRTAVIGTLFLAAYMGGAIATHLTHGENIVFQVVFSVVLWITAAIRFPEITERLLGKKVG